jgi:hypothetical protein
VIDWQSGSLALVIKLGGDFRYWHKADIGRPAAPQVPIQRSNAACGCRWRIRHIKLGVKWEAFTMSHGKQNSKRKARTKAVTVLGVAGALSLAGGASGVAVGPPGDTLTANTAVTLYEEEISDVSLSTFYAFDHESAGARRLGLQLTQRTRGGRPRQGSGGCADDCAGGCPTCCATCATGPGCAQ